MNQKKVGATRVIFGVALFYFGDRLTWLGSKLLGHDYHSVEFIHTYRRPSIEKQFSSLQREMRQRAGD